MLPANYILSVSFLLLSLSNYAQTTLLGKVADQEGKAIVNAVVYLDTVQSTAKTNAVGYFQINVPDSVKTISIYTPKYGYLTAKYNKQTRLSFVFSEAQKENASVTKKKKNNISTKKDDNIGIYDNIYQYIAGKVAGVTVNNDNEISIRGGSSWELSNDPLFVVDGVVTSSIDNILPTDVDNIRILKGVDASIYGSQGANGVIEITTK